MRNDVIGLPVHRDRGAADVMGLVLLAPAVLALAVLVVFVGRQVDARAQVHIAAEAAAQAAVLERSPSAAHAAAQRAAHAMLIDVDTCTAPRVTVDTDGFAPGRAVRVRVDCTVSARGVEVVASRGPTVSATASAVIDPYRAMIP